MDREHVKGVAEKAKGTIKEGAGKLIGDKVLQREGNADSDDFAQAFRFQIARDSDLISPTVPI
jgi:hypothetical protein